MKAAVLEKLEQLKIVERPDPACGDGEVIIAPQAVSVCGSDVRIFHYGNDRVETPTVIGHEVAGEVIEVGEKVERFLADLVPVIVLQRHDRPRFAYQLPENFRRC